MKLKNLILILFLQLVIFGCSKEENENYLKPKISTSEVSEITNTTAICGGDLSSDGGKTIKAKGLVWHTSANATLEANTGVTTETTELDEFVSNLTDLTAYTKYFVRAYATNELGTTYGVEKEFTTTNYRKPEITTSEVSEITNATAICGGDLTSDGGKTITAKGLVWHTLANATLELNTGITTETNELGEFVSNLTDLTTDTKYFVRAYATNDLGTTYGVEKEFTTLNATSIEMVNVQGGTFQMGSNDGDSREKPIHSVTLSSFEIGKYEVTQAQWKKVMGSNPSNFKGDNLPVETVSWNTVQTFITKLNEQTGLTYRLPTEAEWEFAARGGNSSNGYTYAGSNTIGDVAEYNGNSNSSTKPVGGKQANELGIYDMSGNVWEWCNDWYGSYGSDAVANPTGPASGSYRVFRGGSWDYNAAYCRVADRGYNRQSFSIYGIGFRLARSL